MLREKICGIYSIENKTTHKKYIGQSVNIKNRWRCHKIDLKSNRHDNDYLQKAWNKYGQENFVFQILEECSEEMLNERERYYIDLYKTMNRDYGYNLKSGGQDMNYVTEYVKNKISEGNKRYYEQNPEARLKNSIRAKKQWSNPDIKAKITGKNSGMYGHKHTEEARRKIAGAHTGTISKNRNTTPILCIELNKIYKDAVTICQEFGFNPSRTGATHEVCRGSNEHRKTVGGYHWKYVENNI